eukprot:3093599-Prymnesium_polylepis.1
MSLWHCRRARTDDWVELLRQLNHIRARLGLGRRVPRGGRDGAVVPRVLVDTLPSGGGQIDEGVVRVVAGLHGDGSTCRRRGEREGEGLDGERQH